MTGQVEVRERIEVVTRQLYDFLLRGDIDFRLPPDEREQFNERLRIAVPVAAAAVLDPGNAEPAVTLRE